MRTSDWSDPRIVAIGRREAAEAYDIASELDNYGADASRLLRAWTKRDPREVSMPAALADTVMAILLSLPRPSCAPSPSLGENVTVLKAAATPPGRKYTQKE